MGFEISRAEATAEEEGRNSSSLRFERRRERPDRTGDECEYDDGDDDDGDDGDDDDVSDKKGE